MNVLLIAQEPPLAPGGIVTGNAIRARQLTLGLEGAGHRVQHAHLVRQREDGGFRNRDELRSLILRRQPDVLVVAYWELVSLLPFDGALPVVLDFLAPRPLEQLFEQPGQVEFEMASLLNALRKCDLVLVGHDSQAQLLTLPLIAAGRDIRHQAPVRVVPLAAEQILAPNSIPGKEGWTLVSGGVDWPWRDASRYWRELESMPEAGEAGPIKLVLFGGAYPLHQSSDDDANHPSRVRPLMAYEDFSRFLQESAHIGLELAEENIERRYSQSFRSVEFLRHGLPLICNRYLPIAALVSQYSAGWLIDEPQELPVLLRRVCTDPEEWKLRSDGALRLAADALSLEATTAPLTDWMKKPCRHAKLPTVNHDVEPVLGTPPLRQRIARQARMIRRKSLAALFAGREDGGIVLVSRGDLFPTDHGAAVKIIETARALSRLGRPVGLVTDDRSHWISFENGEAVRRGLPWWLRVFALPEPLSKLLHYSRDLPESNAFLYRPLTDGSFFWRTLYVARKIGAVCLQAEFPAYAQPCIDAREILGIPVVLVQHNVEYERLRAQIEELTEEQYQRFRAIELSLCAQSDAVVCVSDNDRARLEADGVPPRRLHMIPHGVDLTTYEQPALASVREDLGIPVDATLLVYHGTFSYPPNIDALQVFAQELLPRLDRLNVNCHVLAIGRKPPPSPPHRHIHFAGSVEHLGPWLKAADIAVVPLREGGGTRMKIIDCFAASLPVVSTSKGIEGIPAVNGRDALIIDDWNEMAMAIARLAEQPDEAEHIGNAGRERADELDWRAIGARYLELYRQL